MGKEDRIEEFLLEILELTKERDMVAALMNKYDEKVTLSGLFDAICAEKRGWMDNLKRECGIIVEDGSADKAETGDGRLRKAMENAFADRLVDASSGYYEFDERDRAIWEQGFIAAYGLKRR